MDLLFSNYPPVKTPFPSFADAFYSLLPQTDSLDIAVGYVTSDSMIELQKAIELNKVKCLNLIIGMHYFDRFTRVEYQTAMRLNTFLTENHMGEVRLVTPFRYHGKIYSFQQENASIAGIIGSNNLSSIVDSRSGIYESSVLVKDAVSLQQIHSFIQELRARATQNIASVEIDSFNEVNHLLEGQDFVERATPEEIARCLTARTTTVFEIPIKETPQSNLNVFFGKGRESMATGVIKPRHWYEAEIIVSKTITTQSGYPQAQSESASFDVITDDGWKFKCKVSGDYSKNFRSDGDLRILGKWLKGRLENAGVLEVGQPVTDFVLEKYGRKTFSLTKTKIQNLWYLDFGGRK